MVRRRQFHHHDRPDADDARESRNLVREYSRRVLGPKTNSEEFGIEPYVVEASEDRVESVRRAFRENRTAAIATLPDLTPLEKQRLFLELVALASFDHDDLEVVRREILALSREWVLANIETAAEFQLTLPRSDGADEHRNLLELYASLDTALMKRLAARAAAHPNERIASQGRRFLEA